MENCKKRKSFNFDIFSKEYVIFPKIDRNQLSVRENKLEL